MADREKAREAERRYLEAHRDEIRARQAAYRRKARAANPEAAREKARAHYAKNRERIRAQALLRYHANPERDRGYSAAYRAKNKARVNATIRAWRQTNPDKAKAASRAWHVANPEAVKACHKRRRARVEGAPINDFTAAQWAALQAAFDHRCAYCDTRCRGKLTQDHIVPLSKGGGHTASNIVPACSSCNSRKHTGPPLRPVQPRLLP